MKVISRGIREVKSNQFEGDRHMRFCSDLGVYTSIFPLSVFTAAHRELILHISVLYTPNY
jgi:hypothetical protein